VCEHFQHGTNVIKSDGLPEKAKEFSNPILVKNVVFLPKN
jgi:hypothetical protein